MGKFGLLFAASTLACCASAVASASQFHQDTAGVSAVQASAQDYIDSFSRAPRPARNEPRPEDFISNWQPAPSGTPHQTESLAREADDPAQDYIDTLSSHRVR